MKKKAIAIFALLAVLLASCGTASYSNYAATEAPYAYTYEDAPMVASVGGAADESLSYDTAPVPAMDYVETDKYNASTTAITERMIIMNVDMTVVVADPTTQADAIDELAKSLGGWVVSMNMYQTYANNGEQYPQVYISIRIPAEKLDSAIDQIKADAIEVQYENRSSQDVTASYVDLESQLSNLQQTEEDLLAIMDEAKNNEGNDSTTKTQDVLNVYTQIANVRAQIESIQGQMKYYEESTSTSLINVTLIAEEVIKPLEIGPWTPKGALQDAFKALINFLRGFVEFVIWFVVLVLPILLVILGPIALIVWAIVAGVKRRKARKLAQKQ